MTETTTAKEQIDKAEHVKKLTRDVFGSGQGKELLDLWKYYFVYGKLFDENPQTTAYFVARRDFVVEMAHIVENFE